MGIRVKPRDEVAPNPADTLPQLPLAPWGIMITLPAGKATASNRELAMQNHAARRRTMLMGAVTFGLIVAVFLSLFTSTIQAQTTDTGSAEIEAPAEQASFFMQIIRNLFDSKALMRTLEDPHYTLAAFIALNVIVFMETGVFFFLPGDSLLVTAGVACGVAGWNLPLLLMTLCLSAIAGDSVGYAIGFKTGPKIFTRQKSWLFNKEHLLEAHAFYEKHGGKTIVLARFMPIVRTFAPVIAGVAKMNYRRFLCFNVVGAVSWVVSMTMIGFWLSELINPTVQYLLGIPDFNVQNHIEKVVILVVLLSISPGIFVWLRSRLKKNKSVLTNVSDAPRQELVNAK
jgi:membrane-associated protein